MRKRISSQEERLRRGRGGRNCDRMVLVRISNLEAEQKTSDEIAADENGEKGGI